METARKALESTASYDEPGTCTVALTASDGLMGHKRPKRSLPRILTARAQEVERRLRYWQGCSQARGVRFQFPGDDELRPFAAPVQSEIASKTGISEKAVCGHCRALAAFGRVRIYRVSEVPGLAAYIRQCVRRHLLPACNAPIGNRNVYVLPDKLRPADEAERPDEVPPRKRTRRDAEQADQPMLFTDPPESELGKTNHAHVGGTWPQHAGGTNGDAPLLRDSQDQHQADDAVVAAEKALRNLGVAPKWALRYATRDPRLVPVAVHWWKGLDGVGIGFLVEILKAPADHGFTRQDDGVGGSIWRPPESCVNEGGACETAEALEARMAFHRRRNAEL
jgi:hypothetical protein